LCPILGDGGAQEKTSHHQIGMRSATDYAERIAHGFPHRKALAPGEGAARVALAGVVLVPKGSLECGGFEECHTQDGVILAGPPA